MGIPSAHTAPENTPAEPDLGQRIAAQFDSMVDQDHKRVIQLSNIAAHQLAQKEDIDPGWSAGANQAIADGLVTPFGGRFDVSMIDCRTDICELRLSSRQSNDYGSDLRDFQDRLAAIREQPWYSQAGFDDASFSVSFVDHQLPVMLICFTRK